MQRTLKYIGRPLGIVLMLTVLSMPVIVFQTAANACEAVWTDNAYGQDCTIQTNPTRFCEKICEDNMEDECNQQCGTSAVGITGAACEVGGTCDCVAECM